MDTGLYTREEIYRKQSSHNLGSTSFRKSTANYIKVTILVKIVAEPVDIIIIQVYMPTSLRRRNRSIIEQIEDLMDEGKVNDQLVLMGDWNFIVEE